MAKSCTCHVIVYLLRVHGSPQSGKTMTYAKAEMAHTCLVSTYPLSDPLALDTKAAEYNSSNTAKYQKCTRYCAHIHTCRLKVEIIKEKINKFYYWKILNIYNVQKENK